MQKCCQGHLRLALRTTPDPNKMSKLLWFIGGGITGAYFAQNYNVPNISDLLAELKRRLSEFEIESGKKPPKS